MSSRVVNTKRNIIWAVLNSVILLVCPFLLRTVMIYVMGLEYAGLGNLFNSILQILSLSELGIGSALVFCMYKPMSEGDNTTINALLNFYRKCYFTIGIVILLLGISLIPFLNSLIAGDIPHNINIYVLYLIYLLNSCSSYFFFGYKRSIFAASQRLDIESKFIIVITLLQYICQISILIFFRDYYMYILVLPICTILTNTVLYLVSIKKFPEFYPNGKINSKQIKTIKAKVIGIVFQKIGTIILTSVDSVVISAFFGLSILGIYNNYYFVITALFSILNAILISIIPSIGNSITLESVEKNKNNFYKFNFIYIFLISWCSTCLFVLFQPFIKIWIGRSLGMDNTLSTGIVASLTIYFYVLKMGDIVHAYKEGIGLWNEAKYIPIIAAITNLIMNLYSVRYIGLYGVILSTIFSVFFIYFPANSYVLYKNYFKNMKEWKKYLLSQILHLVIAILVTVLVSIICSFEINNVYLNFITKIIICLVLTSVAYILVYFKSKYFKETLDFLKDILNKGKRK